MATADPDDSESWRHEILVSLPSRARTASGELFRRAGLACLLLLVATVVVYLDRDGYADNVNGDGISLLDALYYATVTVTTTGYGDITPTGQGARLINIVFITPLRIAFLILLVGTTLEVLANEGRRAFRDTRWRKRMRHHTVVIGYGSKGRAAVKTLLSSGTAPEEIVVLDAKDTVVEEANRRGLAAILGDVNRRSVLERAEIAKAREVIVTLDRDDSAILVTLLARQLNPSAHIVVAVRDEDNVPLLRQSGADIVVTSSDAVGRLMGLSSVSPKLGNVMEDLLSSGEGIEVAERAVTSSEVGRSPADIVDEKVIAVVRGDAVRRWFDPAVQQLAPADRLIVVRRSAQDLSRAQHLAAEAAACPSAPRVD